MTFQNSVLIFFVFLLISCKSNALQSLTDSDFNTFLLRAEELNNSDPKAALVLLNRYKTELKTQPITNQVNYYRIQSAAYIDQALYSLSETSSEQGLKLAKQMNNPSIFIAELAYTKAYALENLGDFEGAFLIYQNGLDVARSMNNQKLIARGLTHIGAILYLQQDYKQSLITLNQALELASAIGDDTLLGAINSELGILYANLDEENQANDYFQQSYQYYKSAGKHNYALNSLHNVAVNHTNQKHFEQAIKVYRVLESEIQPNTSHEFIASVYRNLAWALFNKEDAETESAYRYILLAGEYVEDVEQHLVKLQYLIEKAYILEKMARYQEALVSLEQAEILLGRKTSNIYDTSELTILFLSAKLHYALGHYNQAYQIQTQYFTQSIAGEQARETTEVDELILQYESETAQRHNNILGKKQRIQHLQLQQMTLDVNSRKAFVWILALCTLLLAWCLYRVIKGQRNLINATRTDSLTGVVNRRRLLELGEEYFITAQNYQQAFSVFMIDIDLFKKINDQFSHIMGDKALKEIAIQGQDLMRTSDVFGRFGGEEFIALLPNTGNSEALEVAQRLQENIEQAKWQTQQIKQLTVSIGVATFEQGNYANFSALLKVADEQLLKVKQSGRNTVSHHE
ncbi:GGDEF domain-containing protein [Colwellia sp. MB3u-70]|uniref:tetratricopeptide repeat-containing diguanylate cyclase n=1 Tax=unclassified Colwellia TaxID=196834 RepID=UPI0015F63075|nr:MULTISPECIES: tetratricopeptide repeat-containing diguanylate cyclase [unclassified Colwellia]MBA6292694.1 GGDEF domain-containing protein [Colwellia sp. MB3u-8]MBA6307489.1 GGDEF domain-containing protein [Colwellia sp. MB3u-70]